MANLENTQYFNVKTAPEVRVKEVLDLVYNAMAEKGYNPVSYGCLTASGETCGMAQKKAGSALGRNPLLRE